MLLSILVIISAFIWLMIESDWLRIRLPVGKIPEPKPQTADPYKLTFKPCDIQTAIPDNVAQIIIGGKLYESSDIAQAIS